VIYPTQRREFGEIEALPKRKPWPHSRKEPKKPKIPVRNQETKTPVKNKHYQKKVIMFVFKERLPPISHRSSPEITFPEKFLRWFAIGSAAAAVVLASVSSI
jgi:hypothetical protein